MTHFLILSCVSAGRRDFGQVNHPIPAHSAARGMRVPASQVHLQRSWALSGERPLCDSWKFTIAAMMVTETASAMAAIRLTWFTAAFGPSLCKLLPGVPIGTPSCRVRIADRSGGGGKASMPSFRRRRLGAVPIAVEVAKQSPAAGDNQRATRASERPNNPLAASSRLNVHRGDSTPRYSQQPDAQGGNADPLAHAVILAGSVEQRPNERNPGHSAFSVNPGNQ
jgi:hypothetical protein